MPRKGWRWWCGQKDLHRELLRLLITVTVFLLCMGLMIMAQIQSDRWFDTYNRQRNIAAIQQRLSEPKGVEICARDPLHDRMFDVLPNWEGRRSWLPDLLLNSLTIFTVAACLVFPTERRIKWQPIVTVRRVLWCLAILYVFRICSFMATTVPSPIKGCMPKFIPTREDMVDGVHDYLMLMGQMMSGSVTACTDNIYSGHTSLITLSVGTCLVYSGRRIVRIIALALGTTAIVAIIGTRLHYTVDVLIALFVASFVFAIYHFMLVIFIDAQIMDADKRIHGTTPTDAMQDAHLLSEHALLARMVWIPIGRALWWMDGLDIRVGAYDLDQLPRERERLKTTSLVHTPFTPPLESPLSEACSVDSRQALIVV